MANRHVGDYGQTLTITVAGSGDLETATLVRILVTTPRGHALTWVPATATGSAVTYELADGDLAEPGDYDVRIRAVYASEQWTSTTATLPVDP